MVSLSYRSRSTGSSQDSTLSASDHNYAWVNVGNSCYSMCSGIIEKMTNIRRERCVIRRHIAFPTQLSTRSIKSHAVIYLMTPKKSWSGVEYLTSSLIKWFSMWNPHYHVAHIGFTKIKLVHSFCIYPRWSIYRITCCIPCAKSNDNVNYMHL